jgi:uncharacterized protein YbjT (DUF2867 family)
MILVTAANGNQGKLLVPKLLAADQLVRACVRTQASAEHLLGRPPTTFEAYVRNQHDAFLRNGSP